MVAAVHAARESVPTSTLTFVAERIRRFGQAP
jgi:hypothetical protein